MTLLDQVLGPAVTLGVAYAVIGAAVAVVAAATRTLHLAVGAVATSGLLVALVLGATEVTGIPGPVALAIGVAAGAAVSALLAPLVLARRPASAAWPIGLVVASGILEALLARTLFGRTVRPDPLLTVGRAGPEVTAVVLGLPLVAVLAWALYRTRWGARIRVVGASTDAAERAGVRVLLARSGALAVAGAAAVAAAALAAPVVALGPAQSASLTIRGVAAVALLGRAGPTWAVPGGLLLGLVEAAGQRSWPAAGGEVAVVALVVFALAARGPEAARAWGRAW